MTARGIGIIGAGRVAHLHAQASASEGHRLVGVVASDPERSRAAAIRFGAIGRHRNVEELLADADVEVVHVTSPNALHAEHVMRAIEAGKHVVCEKPFTTDLETASDLVTRVEEAGVVGAVAFTYRYHPGVASARGLVANGALGRILAVRGAYLQSWLLSAAREDWHLDVDAAGTSRALADVGSHILDLFEHILGEDIVSIDAVGSRVRER